jgi:UDP-N-acetylglucosamine--N-acetylmuramyl-(pentapeptide) pyrophosphoryl-undecaprenol N-acetylglucosamine transferase
MISGGGTAGHVYPALTVVSWLTSASETGTRIPDAAPLECLWVGSEGGVEAGLVGRAAIPFAGIGATGLRGKGPRDVARGGLKLARGFWQARQLVAGFRPDVVFVTGGYVCGPVVGAAWLARVPVLIYLPDIEPGLAIRFLARFARRVAVTAAGSLRFFRPGQAVVTGYPVRDGLFGRDHSAARGCLGLTSQSAVAEALPVLLVFGGSQGSHSINQAIVRGIGTLLDAAEVIHLTGSRDFEWVQSQRAALREDLRGRYHVYSYLDEQMVDALAAADLAVARAGASTLGELPAAGLPAVLVPYPYAGAHQWANANFLVGAGAAVTVDDAAVETQLVATALDLLLDADRRTAMGRAMRGLARPDAVARIAHELSELA